LGVPHFSGNAIAGVKVAVGLHMKAGRAVVRCRKPMFWTIPELPEERDQIAQGVGRNIFASFID
jgi:hypothetical protein